MHKAGQVLLRERVSDELKAMWDDLPIINEWDDVLDEGIVKGYTNWQLYGSRKPGHEAYKLTNHVLFTKSGGEWSMREKDINKFDLDTNIQKLSARYSDFPKYDFLEEANTIVEENKNNLNNKRAKIKSAKDKTLDNAANLDDCLEDMFEKLETLEYKLKETHKTYNPGPQPTSLEPQGWQAPRILDVMCLLCLLMISHVLL